MEKALELLEQTPELNTSLACFLRNLAKFDKKFCDAMSGGDEFTLRFEARGDKSRLLFCRVSTDEFDRKIE